MRRPGSFVTTPGRALLELRGSAQEIAEQVGVLTRIVSDPHFRAQLGDTDRQDVEDVALTLAGHASWLSEHVASAELSLRHPGEVTE